MNNLSGLKVPAALETRGIVKMFGGVHALRGVAFELLEGEVHALLGENGAGKSTLMNVIAGNITDYQGSIILGGLPTRFASPADARDAGIALIPQELDLVHGLSIAENLYMGREPHRLEDHPIRCPAFQPPDLRGTKPTLRRLESINRDYQRSTTPT